MAALWRVCANWTAAEEHSWFGLFRWEGTELLTSAPARGL